MALGDLVKSLIVRFSTENYELVKSEIGSIPDSKTVKVGFDGSALGLAISDIGRRMELALAGAGAGGGRSFLAGFASSLGGTPLSGLQGILSTPVVGPAVLGGIAAAVGVLATSIDMIVSGFAAAGAGVVAFGALAYPTFSKISAALAGTAGAMKALDPAQRQLVKGIQALENTFSNMAAKFEPKLMPIFSGLLTIANNLLGPLQTFANAAAPAISGLVQDLAKFTGSKDFKDWVAQLAKLSGPAITAIGKGIGDVATNLGKLLTIFSAKDDVRAINTFFRVLSGTIRGVGDVLNWMREGFDIFTRDVLPALKHAWDNVSHAIDNVRHAFENIGHALDNTGHAFGNIMHAIGNFNHAIDNVRHFIAVVDGAIIRFFTVDIPHWISVGVAWFNGLPGRIIRALGSLGSQLFSSGVHFIQALINGLNSQIGPLLATVGRIASIIAGHFPNSPAKYGPFSGIGAPEKRGEHISWALSQGMLSGVPFVSAASLGVANAAVGGIAGAASRGRGYAGAAPPIVVNVYGWVGNDHQLAMQIQRQLLSLKRRRGYGQPNTGSGLGLA